MRFLIKRIIPSYLLHYYRLWRYPLYKKNYIQKAELKRIKTIPRFQEGKTSLLGKSINFIDSASFLFMYKEIFEQEIYKFEESIETPYIIDAGANIGLASLYIKQQYPNAEIVAFEPDPDVFDILKRNIDKFGYEGITFVQKALWDEETNLTFYQEGADGGRVTPHEAKKDVISLSTIRLRAYLERPVDFLKIDIEGAEVRVLLDCSDLLDNVRKIFVEYHSFVGEEQSLPTLLEVLKSAGFRLNINTPGLKSQQPLLNINTYAGMDMQLNIYGVRN